MKIDVLLFKFVQKPVFLSNMQLNEITDKITLIFSKVLKEDVVLNDLSATNNVTLWYSPNHIPLIKKMEEKSNIGSDLFEITELKKTGNIIDYVQPKTN